MNLHTYGLWVSVVVNSAVLILFAASFIRSRRRRDWQAMSDFSALTPLTPAAGKRTQHV